FGTLSGDIFLEVVRRFDGTNEDEVMRSLERDGLMLNVWGHGGNCRYGLLGVGERAELREGVHEVIRAHLVDVDGTRMTVRELAGGTRTFDVAPGAWVVNCTSHLRRIPTYRVVSDGGLVATPQYALGFSGTTAYYL